MNMGMAEGQYYRGRTVPSLNPRAVFVAAASLPPLSDEGDMRASTPYTAGVIVVHEMRHLWQAAHGWDAADKGKCERDAEAFANTWRSKVREVVRQLGDGV
jgi:hypothetical protein